MQIKRFLCLVFVLLFAFATIMVAASCEETGSKLTTDKPGTGESSLESSENENTDTTDSLGTSTSTETSNITDTTDSHGTSTETTTEHIDSTETEPPKGTPIEITYKSNNDDAGAVWGKQTQTIYYGESKTAEVGAVENFGYKFIGWSDGVITPERSAESFYSDKTIYAMFEIEALEMPIIEIITEDRGGVVLSKSNYKNAKISISNTNAAYTLHDYDTEIRGRGNGTYGFEKKSFRIKLSKKQNLLGQGKGPARSWTLLAYYSDYTMLRGPMTFNFARQMENISHTTSINLVELYFDGEYIGVYLLCEQMQTHEYRVNVNEELMQPDKGYLIEIDRNPKGTQDYRENVGPGGPYHFYAGGRAYELESDIYSQAELDYIKNYVEQCFDAVKKGNRDEVDKLVDIPSLVDTYIVEELIKNLDAGWGSFYMHKNEGTKLFFGPIWDVDFAGGNSNAYGCDNYEGFYVGENHGAMQGHDWFFTLMRYTWFREEVTARWNEIGDKLDTIIPEINAMDEIYRDSIERNFVRWPVFGRNINRTPNAVMKCKNYEENLNYLINWMTNRIEWLTTEFNSESFKNGGVNAAELSVSGGKGTREEPYLISKKDDFISFTNMLKFGNNFAGVYFKQTVNLNLSRSDYNGLGNNAVFAGLYDGGGNSIRVDIQGTDYCVFPYVSGTIINVFTMGSINNTAQAAGIARSLRAGGAIINCASTISITTSSGNSGGITASTEAVSGEGVPIIANCYFAGSLSNNGGGPINAHSSERNVKTINNYYLAGTGTKIAAGETSLTAAEMRSNLPAELNNYLGEAAKLVAGLQASDLCNWSTEGISYPVMTKK